MATISAGAWLAATGKAERSWVQAVLRKAAGAVVAIWRMCRRFMLVIFLKVSTVMVSQANAAGNSHFVTYITSHEDNASKS